ncbi:MAG: hypothetical protein ACRCXB_25035 [Aeromonadaceae bacterium]
MMQLNPEQAGTLLEYMDGNFAALEDLYHDTGHSMDRADSALDEVCGMRDGVLGSAIGPADAKVFIYLAGKLEDFDRPDIIEKLKEVINA